MACMNGGDGGGGVLGPTRWEGMLTISKRLRFLLLWASRHVTAPCHAAGRDGGAKPCGDLLAVRELRWAGILEGMSACLWVAAWPAN